MTAGATLLELMVAIAIFAVLAAIAYGGLQTLLTARHVADEQIARLAAAQKAFALLQQDLSQAAARPIRDEQGDRQPALVGTGGVGAHLELTRSGALDPSHPDALRLLRVGYRLDGDRLIRSTWPVLDRSPDTDPRNTVLLESVEGLSLRYLAPVGEWVPRWPHTETGPFPAQLPSAVEVTLSMARLGSIRRVFPLPQAPGASPG